MTICSVNIFIASSFQLTSSQGGWRLQTRLLVLFLLFQLTSSQGGWRRDNGDSRKSVCFSTHILTRRMTTRWALSVDDGVFSTHILTRRMTSCVRVLRASIRLFNSHPHKEDDFPKYNHHFATFFSTHILTRRMTLCSARVLIRSSFQLTSSQGGWHLTSFLLYFYVFFNSHPHKEDDNLASVFVFWSGFSTHILTRRMTFHPHPARTLSPFQLTSSQGGWPFLLLC